MHCSDMDLDGKLSQKEFVAFFNRKQSEPLEDPEDPEEDGLSAAVQEALTLAHSALGEAPSCEVSTEEPGEGSSSLGLSMNSQGFLQPTVSRVWEEERAAEQEAYEARLAEARSRSGPIYSTTSANASRRSQSPTLVHPEVPEDAHLKAARGRARSPAQLISRHRSTSPPVERHQPDVPRGSPARPRKVFLSDDDASDAAPLELRGGSPSRRSLSPFAGRSGSPSRMRPLRGLYPPDHSVGLRACSPPCMPSPAEVQRAQVLNQARRPSPERIHPLPRDPSRPRGVWPTDLGQDALDDVLRQQDALQRAGQDARFEAAMAASWQTRRFGPAVCTAAVPPPPMPISPSQLLLGAPIMASMY